jgi:hypothetical protein
MESQSLHTKTRLFFSVFLSFVLVLSFSVPVWAYGEDEPSTDQDQALTSNNETTPEGEASLDAAAELENTVSLDEAEGVAFDKGAREALSVLGEPLSLTADTQATPLARAVGDYFEATIDVVDGGITTAVPCTYKITNAGTSDLQVQIGEGISATPAISAATAGALILPDTVSDGTLTYKVTSIGNFAFYRCSLLTDTGLGNNQGITSVGDYAFAYCAALTDTGLATNQTLTLLGASAFNSCTSLTDTGLGSNQALTSLGTLTFAGCTSLTDTGLATNFTITSLGNYAFNYCPLLGTVGTSSTNQGDLVLNSSITNIGEYAFSGTAYTRIYLLTPIRSGVTVEYHAFDFSGGQGKLYVPVGWEGIFFSDWQYYYSADNGFLVVMYPVAEITVDSSSRVPGTSDQATVVFETDTDSTVTIKDSAGNTLWVGPAYAGSPNSATFTVQEGVSIGGLTIETAASPTYPAGVEARPYNTVSGTDSATFDVPAATYSIVFVCNFADNPNAMLTDTMFLTYGQSDTLVCNAFMRAGYTFECWNTLAEATGTRFANEASVISLTAVEEGVVTLYAQWEEESDPIIPEDPDIAEDETSVAKQTSTAKETSTQSSGTTSAKLAQTADTLFAWTLLALGVVAFAGVSLIVLRKKEQ